MQIFLSHATADREVVVQIKAAVGRLATIYCTEDDGRAGVNVHRKIQSKIDGSDFVIALMSKAGANALYVHDEIGWALRSGKLVVPVVAANVTSTELTMLEGTEYIRIDDGPSAAWLDRLVSRVEDLDRHDRLSRFALGVLLIVVGAAIYAES